MDLLDTLILNVPKTESATPQPAVDANSNKRDRTAIRPRITQALSRTAERV
ncbi:hypothetical protein [Nonomuraea sp. NPDC049624]|uniref:hypothetical protein n=1 Tax=Nonomuraea sp. NPDC049624 TaxID=3154354 RepID=UPI0034498178